MCHGFGHKQGFFQGWRFKMVDASQEHALAFRGLIIGLWHEGGLYRSTTYLGSR
jgi:hypothetical protein